jgi:hypothetical protein
MDVHNNGHDVVPAQRDFGHTNRRHHSSAKDPADAFRVTVAGELATGSSGTLAATAVTSSFPAIIDVRQDAVANFPAFGDSFAAGFLTDPTTSVVTALTPAAALVRCNTNFVACRVISDLALSNEEPQHP